MGIRDIIRILHGNLVTLCIIAMFVFYVFLLLIYVQKEIGLGHLVLIYFIYRHIYVYIYLIFHSQYIKIQIVRRIL